MRVLVWILEVFVSKITETSTWIGVIGLLLFILGFQSFLFSFFIFCIFVPETWWDNTAKIKGEELKKWINTTFKE